jgi:glycosyltransferase involved in cell wall biosynthesis
MTNPKVTFIVPCYNLAHLLSECINSILAQTYENFEILIMDDCSPDNTPEVAQSFDDPRVIHVRNEKNLRHLANYNKGIGLARGEYIWLISADDCLRRSYVLERYVQLMNDHPEVGFVFCPAIALQNGKETEIEQWSYHGEQDFIRKGHDFLMRLLQSNCVTAPCGMVRKECYEIELFPLDMPYAGDWYLWCLFALYMTWHIWVSQ